MALLTKSQIMEVILFVILPSQSHYMSSFAFAQELAKKRFKVIFTGHGKNIESLVKQNGFEYVEMAYQTEYAIPSLKYFFSILIVSLISKDLLLKRYKEFYDNILEVKRIVNLTKAETVFIDEHLYQYYFYFLAEKCKIFILKTKLLTNKQGNNPPLSSPYIPKSTFISKIVNELLWIKVLLGHKLKALKYKLAFCGKDDNFFIERFCKKQNINYNAIVNKQSTFYYGLKNVQKVILTPEYLDINVEKNDYSTYICLEYKRKEDLYLTESYQQFKNQIGKLNNQKIILCSFGTVIHAKNTVVIDFLNRLNNAVKDKNYVLIIVSKNPNIIKNKNSNVYIFPVIPQLDVLQYCDIMIHHGGLNTIKECLQFQVPMLIYTPKKDSFDRIGNAARISFKGLGLVGNIYNDNSNEIEEKIKQALSIKIPKQEFEQEYKKVEKFIAEKLLSPSVENAPLINH